MPKRLLLVLIQVLKSKQPYRFQIRISYPNSCRILAVQDVGRPSFHIYDNDEFDTRIGEPPIHGQPLVNSLQKSEVLICSLVREASFEDVKT